MSESIVHATESTSLADLLERLLDKGIVIAGDIRIKLVDIELLTINIRLLVASVDKAREMGIDWWEHSPFLNARAAQEEHLVTQKDAEIEALKRRLERLENSSRSA